MKSRIYLIATGIFILLTLSSSALAASRMPVEMASHWNINGQADGFSSQSSGLWFLPILQLVVVGVLYFIPRLDPMKQNLATFRSTYHMFVAGFHRFLGLHPFFDTGMEFGMEI